MRGFNGEVGKRLAAVLPAVAVGLVAGVTGGLVVAGALDTTPYSEMEYNTAARNAHQAGREEGMNAADMQRARATLQLRADYTKQVDALLAQREDAQASVQDLRRSLNRTRGVSADRQDRIATLQRALAETNNALDRATRRASDAAGQHVQGTLRATWVLPRRERPWPGNCTSVRDAYDVRVTAGAGATVADAELASTEQIARRERNGALTLTCAITYSADIPTPLGAAYELVVTDSAQSGAPAKTRSAPRSALRAGTVPPLAVSR